MKDLDTLFSAIAREYLSIGTLQVRNSDRLDFPDVYVGSLRKALQAAYQAGYERGLKSSRKDSEPS
jgi:hypothetical protein